MIVEFINQDGNKEVYSNITAYKMTKEENEIKFLFSQFNSPFKSINNSLSSLVEITVYNDDKNVILEQIK